MTELCFLGEGNIKSVSWVTASGSVIYFLWCVYNEAGCCYPVKDAGCFPQLHRCFWESRVSVSCLLPQLRAVLQLSFSPYLTFPSQPDFESISSLGSIKLFLLIFQALVLIAVKK